MVLRALGKHAEVLVAPFLLRLSLGRLLIFNFEIGFNNAVLVLVPQPFPFALGRPRKNNLFLLPDAEVFQLLVVDFVHVVDVTGEQPSCEHEQP